MFSFLNRFALLLALTVVIFIGSAQANTLVLTGNPNQVYSGINVGPYPVTLDAAPALVFCLDDTKTANWGGSYAGTVHTPNTAAEEEAAFLASYALYAGSPSSNGPTVSGVEGPISFAIWQIMGTLGSTPVDPNAQKYVNMAQYAYTAGLISQDFLNSVFVFVPTDTTIQRFISAVTRPAMDVAATPEPGTIVLFGTGVMLVALSRLRRRK